MKFGPVPPEHALGAILAHGVRRDGLSLGKGRVLSPDDIDALRQAGVREVVVARLEPGDLAEDEAAKRIAAAIGGTGFSVRAPSTGRVNLHADMAGVFTVDGAVVDRLNTIDPAVTLATLRNHSTVSAGQMIATVKIIPFAVPGPVIETATAVLGHGPVMNVHGFAPKKVGLLQTMLGSTKASVLDKTVRVTEERLVRSGSTLGGEKRVSHETAALAAAIGMSSKAHDMLIVFGASATSDAQDVIPEAIRRAGGEVIHVGMPVDPGNLITLGVLNSKPVIGAPGCARSPKENGFDWVLDRLIAGLEVTATDIEAMGVGGLLAEIPARPRPREATRRVAAPKLHALLLAAGRSSRMGGANKLLATFDGKPLVRRVAEAALGAGLPVTVVTGHQSDKVQAALSGLEVSFAHNADYAEGLSGSLKKGIRTLPAEADGAVVVLADMPGIAAADLATLASAFRDAGGGPVVRATHAGKRGNPVILPKRLFAFVDNISGDTGARQIVEAGHAPVVDVEIGAGASLDVDTPELMAAAGGTLASEI